MSSFLKQSRAPPPATESPIATDRSSSFEGFGSLFDDDGEELNSIRCRESFPTESVEEEKDLVETSSEEEEDSAKTSSEEECWTNNLPLYVPVVSDSSIFHCYAHRSPTSILG